MSQPPAPHKYLISSSPRRIASGEDDDKEEEDCEEEDEDEDASSVPDEPELKKQAERVAKMAADAEEDGEDKLIANPNHFTKKLNIDLSTPRELSRREQCIMDEAKHRCLANSVMESPAQNS